MSPTRTVALLVFASACAREPPPRPARAVPAATAPHAAACVAAGTPDVDAVSGLRPAWSVALDGAARNGLAMDAVGSWIVPRTNGAPSSIDVDTGAACAGLPGGRGGFLSSHSGYLVLGQKDSLRAFDVRTGVERWRHVVVVGNASDTLGVGLQGVAAGAVDVVAFPVLRGTIPGYHWEEHVVAIDPSTGAERWRDVLLVHPTNTALAEKGTLRLVGEASHVLVRTDDALVALDPATGKESWRVPWTAAALAGAPKLPGTGKLPPLVAAGDGRVAIAFPGHLEIHDAATGARLADVALPGLGPTDVVVTKDVVLVAAERTPGDASVTGIEIASGKAAWTRHAKYSVRRLRADAADAYVLEGDGRLWALGLRDGRPAWGISTVAFDFVLARTHAGGARLVFPVRPLAVAAFDPPPAGTVPKPREPFARWEVDRRGDDCTARSIAWVDGDDEVLWDHPLPAWMRSSMVAKCAELETLDYLRNPRATRSAWFTAESEANGALVEVDDTGVLVLGERNGATLLEVQAPVATASQRGLFFDDGTFELDTTPTCKGPAKHGRAFARCGDELVFFNGRTAMLIGEKPWRVESRGAYAGGPAGAFVHATIPLGARTLTLDGRTYMR